MHSMNLFQTNYLPVSSIPDNPSLISQTVNLAIETPNQIHQQQQQKQQQQLQQQSKTDTLVKIEANFNQSSVKSSIDEMSLNELKEECRRKKLGVTGNKQKLIDRLKSSISGQSSNGVKSPDSGVNMDSSSSFGTSEQSLNKAGALHKNPPEKQQPSAAKTSSLDDFFNCLDIDNLGTDSNKLTGNKSEPSRDV